MALFLRFLFLAAVGFILARALRHLIRQLSASGARRSYDSRQGGAQQGFGQSTSSRWDPHEELGVPKGASREEIKTAYKEALKQYHPDKVSHLGPELQQLAREKTNSINKAYEVLGG